MKSYRYHAIVPKQNSDLPVFSFAAKAGDILNFASIDRIGRDEKGHLKGFQRPQVANHRKEIREYLRKDDAVLPNSVVVAFTQGVELKIAKNGRTAELIIASPEEAEAFVVDGQQRLTALQGLPDRDFEVLVSGLICDNEEELRKQFILINNTKPLPKTLIYELLPSISELPHRLSSRSVAAAMVEKLNFDKTSSLCGQISQHTNPDGVIKDTVLQKVIMNSISDGAFRDLSTRKNSEIHQLNALSDFYAAVQNIFKSEWEGKTPKTSRLVHGVGIISMGFVFEYLYSTQHDHTRKSYERSLKKIKGKCAWTSGHWTFGENNIRPWNGLQFLPRDYLELSNYLIRLLKQ